MENNSEFIGEAILDYVKQHPESVKDIVENEGTGYKQICYSIPCKSLGIQGEKGDVLVRLDYGEKEMPIFIDIMITELSRGSLSLNEFMDKYENGEYAEKSVKSRKYSCSFSYQLDSETNRYDLWCINLDGISFSEETESFTCRKVESLSESLLKVAGYNSINPHEERTINIHARLQELGEEYKAKMGIVHLDDGNEIPTEVVEAANATLFHDTNISDIMQGDTFSVDEYGVAQFNEEDVDLSKLSYEQLLYLKQKVSKKNQMLREEVLREDIRKIITENKELGDLLNAKENPVPEA